jgi:hypothetical protein
MWWHEGRQIGATPDAGKPTPGEPVTETNDSKEIL